MERGRALLATVLLMLCAVAHAAPYEDELLRLEVPAGFVGPVRQRQGAEGMAVAYSKPHTGDRGTLLMIAIYDVGSKLPKLSKADLGAAAERYLLQFLSGVERRRTLFEASKPSRLELGGLPAARVTWRGIAQGFSMFGTMYCVIVGTRVVTFHTQDFEGAPPENTSEVIRSFESVQFKHAG
jgi:hypothetical protein